MCACHDCCLKRAHYGSHEAAQTQVNYLWSACRVSSEVRNCLTCGRPIVAKT